MFYKKFNISFIMTVCSLQVLLFSGCASNNTKLSTRVGPSLSSSYSEQKGINSVPSHPKLDVIIPVFDPGLPQDPDDYEDENIWPEIRRAEANRFAYKLKEKLDETGQFGSVRVTHLIEQLLVTYIYLARLKNQMVKRLK